nr:MAG: hypothetical protein AM325_00620 [Candidatus Thorarchaeota archaeon SMTZ1-45]
MDEWREVIDSTPTPYERGQLEAYEREVLEEDRRLNRRDTDPPKNLKKAVLVVDLKENWETLRDHIESLVLQAHHSSKGATLSNRHHLAVTPENKNLRMGLVVFSDTEKKRTKPVKAVTYFNPFSRLRRCKDDRSFTLYLTVSGKGSPAESAARIAARWHGLELINDRTRESNRKIVWFDLSGELRNWKKRRRIFRSRLLSKSMRNFLRKDIRFVDLSGAVASYLQGHKDFGKMKEEVLEIIRGVKNSLLIFSGSDRIRTTLTRRNIPQFDELVALMLETIPGSTSVIWFDRPVPTNRTSQRYDTRSVAPFYNDSVWMELVDEVIYNVPTAPIRYGSYVPVEDDIRWVVTETTRDTVITQVLVPPLYKWGERFRPDRDREENITQQNVYFLRSSYANMRKVHVGTCEETDKMAILELIPHLRRFYDPDPPFNEENEDDAPIRSEWLLSEPSEQKPFLSRVNYTPYQHLTEKKGSKQDGDGRVTRLEPLEKINHRRAYRKTRLYGKPRKVTTRPPHISVLKYRNKELNNLYLKELSGIRRVLKTLRKHKSEDEELRGLLETLNELINRKKIKRNPEDRLRAVRAVLEKHPLTKRVWNHLRVTRSRLPKGLPPEQRKVLKQLVDQHPDILMVMGNQFFLMLSVAAHKAGVLDATGDVVEDLWEYLIPWQLISLGYEPEYPENIPTGESVLHRPQLMDRLSRRVTILMNMRMGEEVHSVQFGKAAVIDKKNGTSLFMTFQTRPGSRDMNTIFLRLSYVTEGQIMDVFKELCREKPFWGESDPTRLGELSDTVDLNECVNIMVATHRGVRGLWLFDEVDQIWRAIGRFDYYARKRETVTLLMSVTLREESTLEDLSDDRVRGKTPNLRNIVEVGLGTVSAVFKKCEFVRCRLSLDDEESMFRLSFHRRVGNREIAHLLIKRTVNVIEVLRRPDFYCEQVVVNGHEMVWNRFNDIEYVGVVNLVKPWVERMEPFKTVDLSLPKTADQFIKMEMREGLRLTVRHDPRTCPLCVVPKDELRKRAERHTGDNVSEYLRWIEGERGQPEELMRESIYRHGVCWRIGLQSDEKIPDTLKQLEKIALSGPAIATLLETGAFSYRTEEDGWVMYEYVIPKAENLPREFRESIHLMRWRRENATMPGQYILEEWEPDISLGIEEITFSLESQVTGEKQTHVVKRHRPDLMHPESLGELLELEMSKLVDREGVEDDERLKGLAQELIAEIVELGREAGPTTWSFEGLGWVTKRWFERVLEATFTSPDGERIDIEVTQGIHFYLNWVEFSGGVDRDDVSDTMDTILTEYGIEEEVRNRVTEEVLTELEKEGIVFFQDL